MRLALDNRTDWRIEDIRAIVDAVAAEELMPRQKKYLRITVFHKNAKDARADRFLSGRRHGDWQAARRVGLRYNAFNVTLPKLVATPKPDGWIVEHARLYLCIQLAHEMAECRGKAHADMHGSTRYGYRTRVRPWADYWRKHAIATMPLRWEKPAAEPKPTRTPEEVAEANLQVRLKHRALRLAQAERMVALWTRRQKLASTHLAKWKRRLRARQRGLSR